MPRLNLLWYASRRSVSSSSKPLPASEKAEGPAGRAGKRDQRSTSPATSEASTPGQTAFFNPRAFSFFLCNLCKERRCAWLMHQNLCVSEVMITFLCLVCGTDRATPPPHVVQGSVRTGQQVGRLSISCLKCHLFMKIFKHNGHGIHLELKRDVSSEYIGLVFPFLLTPASVLRRRAVRWVVMPDSCLFFSLV
jgi:hypothetical protein